MNSAISINPESADLQDCFYSLMECSPLPTAELEGTGHIIRYINSAFCRLVGKSRTALVGTPFADTVQEDDDCLALLERVSRTGEAETHTGSTHPQPHSAFWSYVMWPVRDGDQHPQHPVRVIVQVTETVQFHEQTIAMNEALLRSSVRQHELTQAAEKLSDQLQTEITMNKQAAEKALADYARALAHAHADLRQVAYVSAHDLQEPVRQVGLYTQMVAQHYDDGLDADLQDAVAFIVEGTKRMQAQFTDLLHYLEIEEPGDGITTTDCELLFHSALEAVREPIATSNATITHEPLPTLAANAKHLQMVFRELLDNAIKFRTSLPPCIHVWAEREGPAWRFAVRDNGLGIAPGAMGQLFGFFRKFQQRTDYPGTGMGLAICKKIIDRHGGRIWVESTPGEGSVFYFTISDRHGKNA